MSKPLESPKDKRILAVMSGRSPMTAKEILGLIEVDGLIEQGEG